MAISFSFFSMPPLIARIYRSGFVRSVVILATGTAGAQAISVIFAPVIARLYGPVSFGLFGTFMAIVAVLAPVSALSYPIAIVLPENDQEARDIARLANRVALGIGLLITFILIFGGEWLTRQLRVQEIGYLVFLIPAAAVFSAWQQIFRQWLIRKKQFAISAKATVTHALAVNVGKAGFGWFLPVGAVLIILHTAGVFLYAALLALGHHKLTGPCFLKQNSSSHDHKNLLATAKKYYDFPIYRAPQVFANGLSQGMPIILLASFFGPAAAGFYALCGQLLGVPTRLIGKSVGDVFYPRIAEAAQNEENLTSHIGKATLSLAMIGIIPFGLLAAFSPWLFAFVFGEEWVIAGEYARWLSFWKFFGFINRPSVESIPVLGLQGYFLVYEIVSITLRMGILFSGFFILQDDIITIILFSIAGVILNLFLIFSTLYASKTMKPRERRIQ